jgi:hypothetical protein
MFLLMHKCQQSLNELFNDALRTYEVNLAFQERYKDIGCQVCKMLFLTISGRGAATKIKSVGFVSEARLCHERKMSATTNNFLCEKKMVRESSKCTF